MPPIRCQTVTADERRRMDERREKDKAQIGAYLEARRALRTEYDEHRKRLDRRVLEVARGLELQEHGKEIELRQRYGPWFWKDDRTIAVRVDDSFMGDIHVHDRTFDVRQLLR